MTTHPQLTLWKVIALSKPGSGSKDESSRESRWFTSLRLLLSLLLGIGGSSAFTHTWVAAAAAGEGEEEALLASSAHFLEKPCIDPVCDLRERCHREVAERRSRSGLGKRRLMKSNQPKHRT